MEIIIKGARQHNLAGVDLTLPRNALIVVTGVSGSGKSSLALDTIYAEGQRRYVESLSAYARQFLERMPRPDVEQIEGLSPAIAIQQRPLGVNPRSTVATATEIHDYLRVLYARLGVRHCARCGEEVGKRTVQQMVDDIMSREGERILVTAPCAEEAKGNHRELLDRLAREGFVRARIDGEVVEIAAAPDLKPRDAHTIEVVIDRLEIKPAVRNRLTDSMELALRLGAGRMKIVGVDDGGERIYTEELICDKCGEIQRDLDPRHFSFNSPHGACPACHGLGRRLEFVPGLVIDPSRSLEKGAVRPFRFGGKSLILHNRRVLRAVARHYGFPTDVPFGKLAPRWRRIVLNGSGKKEISFRYWRRRRPYVHKAPFPGALEILTRRFAHTKSSFMRRKLQPFMKETVCAECGGRRLRPEARAVTFGGKTLDELTSLSVGAALRFVEDAVLPPGEAAIGADLLKEVRERLRFMERVGLGYLTLDRESATLSGGEAQRTRLATQIGSGLVGVLYVLDEPSVGLHLRDNERLLESLKRLRDLGNTVIVIEHDEATIRAADFIVDLGPGAGIHGGRVVARGSLDDVIASPQSLTGRYLSGESFISVPASRRKPPKRRALRLLGARHHNLKDVDVTIPLGLFCCVTGVSGAGKSTLVDDTLMRALAGHFFGAQREAGEHRALKGIRNLDKVVVVSQAPIGRTPRSNPATYTGIYTHVRDLFARHPESRARGYGPGRFSFNVKGGRCEACRGDGTLRVEMHFLPDVYVTCESCGGRRYNRETLDIRFKGKNIADVLDMTVEEALVFFRHIPPLKRRLEVLNEVGLGYITLGQPATTLSGGEAQRVKLARELGKVATGRTLYVLDEPTTGLHFADIQKLIDVLQRLVDAGNTVLVVEHNMEVIKCADWIIDLGPEGGDEGGYIVAEGPPEKVAACPRSHTGRYLKKVIFSM